MDPKNIDIPRSEPIDIKPRPWIKCAICGEKTWIGGLYEHQNSNKCKQIAIHKRIGTLIDMLTMLIEDNNEVEDEEIDDNKILDSNITDDY
jgi:hypothetical protein